MDEHHVHVAPRIQFAAAVTAEREHRERLRPARRLPRARSAPRPENVAQEHIHHIDAARANFAAAAAGLVFQAQPMLLDARGIFCRAAELPSGAPAPAGASWRSACARTFSRWRDIGIFELGFSNFDLTIARRARLIEIRNSKIVRARSRNASSCCKAWAAGSRAPRRPSSCCRGIGRAPAESRCVRGRSSSARRRGAAGVSSDFCKATGSCTSAGNSFTVICPLRERTTAYSIAFCNSRTLPGQP